MGLRGQILEALNNYPMSARQLATKLGLGFGTKLYAEFLHELKDMQDGEWLETAINDKLPTPLDALYHPDRFVLYLKEQTSSLEKRGILSPPTERTTGIRLLAEDLGYYPDRDLIRSKRKLGRKRAKEQE